jgi:hypothetical protein
LELALRLHYEGIESLNAQRGDNAMRFLIILAVVVLLLAIAGWITFSKDSGRTSINIETNEIREDTGQIMNQGAELLNNAEDEIAPDGEQRQAPE